MDEELLQFGEQLKDAVSLMRKYKSENNLSMRADVDEFVVDGSREFEGWFQATEKDLVRLLPRQTGDFQLHRGITR